jgi:hypothetical protein
MRAPADSSGGLEPRSQRNPGNECGCNRLWPFTDRGVPASSSTAAPQSCRAAGFRSAPAGGALVVASVWHSVLKCGDLVGESIQLLVPGHIGAQVKQASERVSRRLL